MNKQSSLTLKDKLIHKRYLKNRLIIFSILVITLLSITVGYSANLSTVIYALGHVNLNVEEGKLEITNIENKNLINATNNGYNISYNMPDDSTYTLTTNFDIGFYRSGGSSSMYATYQILINNNSFKTWIFNEVNNNAVFTSANTSSISYALTGANPGTTILAPGESIIITVTFTLGNNNRNTQYTVNNQLELEFTTDNSTTLNLTSILKTRTTNFSTNDSLVKLNVYVLNDSNTEVTYNFSGNNNNFYFVNSDGNILEDFIIPANSSEEISIYLKIADNHIFIDTSEYINIELVTKSPVILTYDIGNVTITVPNSGSQEILKDKEILLDSSIDFTSISTTSGVFQNSTSGEITYFYRGNVVDNYVDFAGYTWRIIRIDKYGTRIILDSTIGSSQWATSNTVSNLTEATSKLSFGNSLIKTKLDEWYNANLSNYRDIIKESLFCEDFSYQTMTSSGSNYTTYYFGSYIRNGKDSSGYTPEFVCEQEYTKTYNIGLISGDEVSFAGAKFETNNTNYYLYNPNISEIWWTISPSYYDTTLTTVGTLIINGSTGNFYDWQNGSTIANTNSIRPVITLDTDRLSGGNGNSGSPYVFS